MNADSGDPTFDTGVMCWPEQSGAIKSGTVKAKAQGRPGGTLSIQDWSILRHEVSQYLQLTDGIMEHDFE